MNLTKNAEDLIVDLAEMLDIPRERYESADRSYQSLASWFDRPGSSLAGITMRVYTQGSFRLGTAIKPLSGEEHYDLDIVCEFDVNKTQRTQRDLQETLGLELRAYAIRHGMEAPERWDRCWTLNYADSAQFHMDVLPSTPDGQRQRSILELHKLANPFTDKAVAITDRKHANFRTLGPEWPTSNPDGYADWFYLRMKPVLEKRQKSLDIFAEADVAAIPRFRDKTPLQAAIQVLKRHRDVRFAEAPELRPSSIIITTLAAHAYGQEESISGALFGILEKLESSVPRTLTGDAWIANPTDPRENFADGWRTHPERKDAFFDWLRDVREDFTKAAQLGDVGELIETLAPRMGRQLMEAAASVRTKASPSTSLSVGTNASTAMSLISSAPHRKPVPWALGLGYLANLVSATQHLDGFRPTAIQRSESTVRAGSRLTFAVKTNVPKPYKVYWQIVNTGRAATEAADLRGGFEEYVMELGYLSKTETARYHGTHSIECFIVKDGVCAARTSPFVVIIV